MPENEIIAEIHRHREAFVRECHFDLQEMARRYREAQERYAAAGHPVVSFEGQPPVELPPVDWEKVNAAPENEIITEIRATRRAMSTNYIPTRE